MAGPGKIDIDNKIAWAKLAEIAKFAIGSNERLAGDTKKIKGGAGRIGLIGGHVVKFNTHASERRSGPKANQAMRNSCNALRMSLYKIAQDLGVDGKTLKDIRSKLGIREDGTVPANKKLLDRTVVVSVIKRIGQDGNLARKEIDVWKKMDLDVKAIKDLASTKVDAATRMKTKLDTHFQVFLAPPKKKVKEIDGQIHIEQHGFLGLQGVAKYAKSLVKGAEKFSSDGNTITTDVKRGTILRLGGVEVSKKDISINKKPISDLEAQPIIWEKFKSHFPGDEDFARCVSRIADQTLFNSGEGAQAEFYTADEWDNDFQYKDPKTSEETIEISPVNDNSVTITARRVTTIGYVAQPVDMYMTKRDADTNSSRLMVEYSVCVTKLGDDEDTTGANVAKVGKSYFRFDVDPRSRIDATVVCKDKERERKV